MASDAPSDGLDAAMADREYVISSTNSWADVVTDDLRSYLRGPKAQFDRIVLDSGHKLTKIYDEIESLEDLSPSVGQIIATDSLGNIRQQIEAAKAADPTSFVLHARSFEKSVRDLFTDIVTKLKLDDLERYPKAAQTFRLSRAVAWAAARAGPLLDDMLAGKRSLDRRLLADLLRIVDDVAAQMSALKAMQQTVYHKIVAKRQKYLELVMSSNRRLHRLSEEIFNIKFLDC